jgi:hypothetical protein
MALSPARVRTNAYFVKQNEAKIKLLFFFFEDHWRNSGDHDAMHHENWHRNSVISIVFLCDAIWDCKYQVVWNLDST